MIRISSLPVIGLCAFLWVGTGLGDEYSNHVRQILETHWKQGSSHRGSSKKVFETTSTSTKAKSDFQKAYLLNRVFHARNSEAYEIAKALTRADRSDLDAWYLKAWLEFASGKVDRGLITLQSYKKSIESNKDLKAAVKQKNLKRIGRMLGFSEIVSTAKPKVSVNETTYEETVAAVLDGLNFDEKEMVNSQRKKVTDQFNEFRRRSTVLKNDEKIKLLDQRNREINQIQKQSKLLEAQAKNTEPKLTKLKVDFDKRRTELETKATPVASELSRLSASVSMMEQQLRLMYNDLFFTESYALRTRDPFVRRRLFQQADFIVLNIREQEFALSGLYGQARGLSGELSILNGALNDNRLAFQNESGLHRKQLNDIQRKLRRNAKKVTQLSKDPSVLTGKLVAINTRAGALRSYDSPPLESMRAKILDSLKK